MGGFEVFLLGHGGGYCPVLVSRCFTMCQGYCSRRAEMDYIYFLFLDICHVFYSRGMLGCIHGERGRFVSLPYWRNNMATPKKSPELAAIAEAKVKDTVKKAVEEAQAIASAEKAEAVVEKAVAAAQASVESATEAIAAG